MYCASVTDKETISCRRLYHLIAYALRVINTPVRDMDFSPLYLASVYTLRSRFIGLFKMIPSDFVEYKYAKTWSAALKFSGPGFEALLPSKVTGTEISALVVLASNNKPPSIDWNFFWSVVSAGSYSYKVGSCGIEHPLPGVVRSPLVFVRCCCASDSIREVWVSMTSLPSLFHVISIPNIFLSLPLLSSSTVFFDPDFGFVKCRWWSHGQHVVHVCTDYAVFPAVLCETRFVIGTLVEADLS